MKAIPKREMATFTGVVNCWRMEATESAVALRRCAGSGSTTSTEGRPSRVSQNATAAPITPPPAITTS